VSIPSELPRELQEVETDLQAALAEGGVNACERLVDKLAVEAETGHIITNEVDLAILELEEQADAFPEINTKPLPRREELAGLGLASQMAVLRHTYAIMRLHQIKANE